MLIGPILSPNELIDFTVNYNSGPYYVFGTFNLNQGLTTERSLNDTDRIKEYMPNQHQQQP
jgi:outer membrane translocation and assembly module TamA